MRQNLADFSGYMFLASELLGFVTLFSHHGGVGELFCRWFEPDNQARYLQQLGSVGFGSKSKILLAAYVLLLQERSCIKLLPVLRLFAQKGKKGNRAEGCGHKAAQRRS
jgi:hypothetical protein